MYLDFEAVRATTSIAYLEQKHVVTIGAQGSRLPLVIADCPWLATMSSDLQRLSGHRKSRPEEQSNSLGRWPSPVGVLVDQDDWVWQATQTWEYPGAVHL